MVFRFIEKPEKTTIPIVPIEKEVLGAWLKFEPRATRAWVESSGFKANDGEISLMAGPGGRLARVLCGMALHDGFWSYAGLPEKLPPGSYRIDAVLDAKKATGAAIGWALGCYSFTRYKKPATTDAERPALVWPRNCDKGAVRRTAAAIFLIRDLINTPAGDMGPAELARAVATVARRHKAQCRVIVGGRLLEQNYPTIHAVGRASSRAPRLVDLRWGSARAPKVTLIGKGVCFDTGGLDLKISGNMLRMKKDMGGAAIMLGLADMIMGARLPVRLRLLIPAVENSVAGNALHPLDVVKTRKGITVEIGNTDAEGRLILCDALTEADAENPALIVDCATLTGAARVALGGDLAALFCNNDALAGELLARATAENDPMWRMPLWAPYRKRIESKIADVNNVSEGAQAGAITAALYLNEFVRPTTPWVHLDVYGWNDAPRPGRPPGGEAQTIRALFALIAERFDKRSGSR